MQNYESPIIEISEITACDVLTASNGTPFLPYSWFEENASEQEL